MFTTRFASAVAAATLLSMVVADSSSSSIWSIPTPTATVPANAMVDIGCFETGIPLEDHGVGDFMSPGSCQQICLGLEKKVLGLSDGTNCWCGDLIPPKDSQTDNSSCSTTCSGTDKVLCGGDAKLWVVLTGLTRNKVDNFVPSSSSSSRSAVQQTSAAVSTVIETSTDAPASAPKDNGPNKAGIAAGVVVGVVGLAAIVGGVVFWLRQKRRREVEEEYRRQAANVSSFVAGGKLHTSNSSMTDSRLDPDFMNRRQSNGSIADNEDYSRRILKVTNA